MRHRLGCADVCAATATLGNRRTGSNEEVIRKMLEACITACRLCGDECRRHADRHEHCGESCQPCAAACQDALRSM
ncbi:MAG: four-helix bundle copper-binding protein [Vicinamibacterales bacterium]